MNILFDNETILNESTREKIIAARHEGQKLKKHENAKNLLKEGLSVELIARAINMPISEVSELKSKMAN